MQRVVSDSDVLIHLAKLNELILIKKLYGGAYIPRYGELEMRRYQYDEIGIIEDVIQQGILKVYETDDSIASSIAKEYIQTLYIMRWIHLRS